MNDADNKLKFEVGLTGPDHEPTTKTKWYAQVRLVRFDQIPVGLKTYAFGYTPGNAMSNLESYLSANGVCLK